MTLVQEKHGARAKKFLGCPAEELNGLCDEQESGGEFSRADGTGSSRSNINAIKFFEQHESLTLS